MQKFHTVLFISTIVLLSVAGKCNKKPDPVSNETNLSVTLDPPANSTQPAAPGPSFPLKVTVTSTMPPQGVQIDVSAKKDGSADPNFFTQTLSTSNAASDFSITGTPAGITALVTVTVTSKTKATNKVTLTYRYSRK